MAKRLKRRPLARVRAARSPLKTLRAGRGPTTGGIRARQRVQQEGERTLRRLDTFPAQGPLTTRQRRVVKSLARTLRQGRITRRSRSRKR